MSDSLARSLGRRWEADATLCALIPYNRVFTGRVPQTELFDFPYVSILVSQGYSSYRSDKTRGSRGPVSFHIWVDDARLEQDGFAVAEAIRNAFADKCWAISDDASVIDVLDGGEPDAKQVPIPGIKAWEVIQMFIFCVERARVDADECCPGSYTEDSSSSS